MPDPSNTLRPAPERDEAVGYRPVSAPAVAAIMLAGATALAVVVTWFMAWVIRKRPILVWQLLPLAALSVVWAIVAVRHVRRSQGARTGLRLARTALWLSVACLGGYGAYYLAIDAAVRQQARGKADEFFARLAEGKPELAFRLTRDRDQQRTMDPEPDKIRARFGSTDLHQFDESELARVYRSWADKDRIRLEYAGPGERDDQPNGFVVQLNYAVHCPEGRYDIDVWARGVDDPTTGSRDWQIVFPRTGVRGRKLTQLGRLAGELQSVCTRNYLRGTWQPSVPQQKPEELAAIVRIEGAAPPEDQRQKLVAELRAPRAINLLPGYGPMRATPFPTIYLDANSLRLVQFIQVETPTLNGECPAFLTVSVLGDELVKELVRLTGPDWASQPLLANEEYPSQLTPYRYEFKVTELNLRPSLPPVAPPPSGGS
ncbi:MAG TPA: hypothetical protein VH120_18050 [Gemmataceae bacterium]|jgi:hypothetical protein|nr:hypothetical protein [Gemmataceae bacterium]